MIPLTELSTEAVPAIQASEARTDGHHDGNGSPFAAMNPFLDRWLDAIAGDGTLTAEAYGVARVMARSVGIGRVAFTDWHRINAALGRNRRDRAVFRLLSELELEGYISRNIDDRFGLSYGFSLLIPEGGL